MDTKYKSHSFIKLWIATTIFILCCFTTDMSAQNAAAADTVAAVTETITEVVAAPAEEEASAAPDTVGELALGLNTVWMLLAAMLVFFMQPRSRFYQSEKYCQHSDEELCRFHVRLFTILVYRFRIDVRRRRIHRNASLLRPFFH